MKIKRIYESAAPEDGYRMLIDRIWPRGVSKKEAQLDEWNKDIAPSTELRKWFGHKPERFEEFADRYREELKGKSEELNRIKAVDRKQMLTLLYAAKEERLSNAAVLQQVLNQIE